MKHNNSIKDKLDKRFQASKKTKNDIVVDFDQGEEESPILEEPKVEYKEVQPDKIEVKK